MPSKPIYLPIPIPHPDSPRRRAMADQSPPWRRPMQLLVFLLSLTTWRDAAATQEDGSVLLQFKNSLSSGGADAALITWVGKEPCTAKDNSNWKGVRCERGNVSTLLLEKMNLSGSLSLDVLSGLPSLHWLSFINNSFEGAMPDITKLPKLKYIYLSGNRFSGEIPDGMFSAMRGLVRLRLSQNNFSGPIPISLTDPKKLREVRLDGNKLEGQIPDFPQLGLEIVDVAYNNLQGQIPGRLSTMSAVFFEGNKDLCGPPLAVQCKSSKKKLSPYLLVGIILISTAALLAVVGVIIFFVRRKKGETTAAFNGFQSSKTKGTQHLKRDVVQLGRVEYHEGENEVVNKEEKGKLSFVGERREKFEIEDLLRASAEVLGSGNFGSSYKAILLNGPAVVVKQFKEIMNAVGREDFEEHMRRLGRLSHPNLLPLLAYYYKKEQKLLITDYIPNGSLAHMLHGNRGSKISPLDWLRRLKIIKGVARGLAYLYEELSMLTVPHGHLKSTNVLLDLSFEPILTDYALVPVMSKARASEVMVAYKSPECTKNGKPSKKSDVWSLGILILEVITGKYPANHLTRGREGTDLAGWVNSVVREEWTGEVFDSKMKGTTNGEGEMLKLLQIGMACCETDVDRRWEMELALQKIEELKERESDAEYSSIISEGDGYYYSSKAMTEDDLSFSINN